MKVYLGRKRKRQKYCSIMIMQRVANKVADLQAEIANRDYNDVVAKAKKWLS